MIRFTVVFLFGSLAAIGQIRMSKLEVPAGKTFVMKDTNVIEVDTLVLGDSAIINLSRKHVNNYIRVKVMRAGNGSQILGHGNRGSNGKAGAPGTTPDGPCHNGSHGRHGAHGGNGEHGANLFIHASSVIINGSLTIDISGGNGGDAGRGGAGGGGSPGTRVCVGGSGGPGGHGGIGGNGGNGGSLTFSCKDCLNPRLWLGNKLVVRSYAGYGGIAGDAGPGGLAGLGAGGDTAKDGKAGQRGRKGMGGKTGREGAVNFEVQSK
jgi:hypothetical protein